MDLRSAINLYHQRDLSEPQVMYRLGHGTAVRLKKHTGRYGTFPKNYRYAFNKEFLVMARDHQYAVLSLDDILATDWEVSTYMGSDIYEFASDEMKDREEKQVNFNPVTHVCFIESALK